MFELIFPTLISFYLKKKRKLLMFELIFKMCKLMLIIWAKCDFKKTIMEAITARTNVL